VISRAGTGTPACASRVRCQAIRGARDNGPAIRRQRAQQIKHAWQHGKTLTVRQLNVFD
jgi:hypothetical protein